MWTHKSETAPNLSIRRPVNNPFTILFRLFFLFHTTMYTHTLHQGLHTVRLHIGSFYHFPQKNEKKKKRFFLPERIVSQRMRLCDWRILKKKRRRKKKLLGLLLCVSSLFFRVPVYLFLSYNNKAPLCFHTHLTIEKENSFFFILFSLSVAFEADTISPSSWRLFKFSHFQTQLRSYMIRLMYITPSSKSLY